MRISAMLLGVGGVLVLIGAVAAPLTGGTDAVVYRLWDGTR